MPRSSRYSSYSDSEAEGDSSADEAEEALRHSRRAQARAPSRSRSRSRERDRGRDRGRERSRSHSVHSSASGSSLPSRLTGLRVSRGGGENDLPEEEDFAPPPPPFPLPSLGSRRSGSSGASRSSRSSGSRSRESRPLGLARPPRPAHPHGLPPAPRPAAAAAAAAAAAPPPADGDGDELETVRVKTSLFHVDTASWTEKEHIWMPGYCYFCYFTQTKQEAQTNALHTDLVRFSKENRYSMEPEKYATEMQLRYNETIRPSMERPDGEVGPGLPWSKKSIWDHDESHATVGQGLDHMALRVAQEVMQRIRDNELFCEEQLRHPVTKEVVKSTPSYDPKHLAVFWRCYEKGSAIQAKIQKAQAVGGSGVVS